METSLRQSLTIAQGDLLIFFKRPFSATLMILVIIALELSLFLSAKDKRKILKVG
jgi:TctA family transporter